MEIQQYFNQLADENAVAAESKFSLQSKKCLRVRLDGPQDIVWTRLGAMIAWVGDKVEFSREGILEGGLTKSLFRAISSTVDPAEQIRLMKCYGKGIVYLAHQEEEITLFRLNAGEAFVTDGDHLLAFENSVKWSHKFNKLGQGARAGGLMQINLTGPGLIAIIHSGPLVPVPIGTHKCTMADPDAVVAWTGNAEFQTVRAIKFKALAGRQSGEEIQMAFRSKGGKALVFCQPHEAEPEAW